MQILSKSNNDFHINRVLEAIKKAAEENVAADKSVAYGVITKGELNSFAGSVFAYKEVGPSLTLVKAIVVPHGLDNVAITYGGDNTGNPKIEVPALPRDLVSSKKYRTVLRDQIAKRLGKPKDQLKMLPLVSTPSHFDVEHKPAIEELFITLYNEIAVAMVSATKPEEAKLQFRRNDNNEGQKLVITADFGGADIVDEFGKDVRSDILVSIGRPGKTNDDIGNSAEAQYGQLSAYMDFMYHMVTVPSQQYGVPDIKVPYMPRLNLRAFAGPDGHNTLEHNLFAVGALRAIYSQPNLPAMCTYPQYGLPANEVDLRNVGALACDFPCSVDKNGDPVLEYIPLHAKKDTKLHTALVGKLIQRSLRVAICLRPFQIHGSVHADLLTAAIGNQESIKRVIAAAVHLTGGDKSTFNSERYIKGNASIFEANSILTTFAGEWLNPLSGKWEDLSRLDAVAAFNLLCNDPKAGAEFQQLARQFTEFMLPVGNNHARVAELWTTIKKLANGAKNIRIDDYEYRPMFTKVFLDDLSNAINAQTSLTPRVIAPSIHTEAERGASIYSFGNSGDFANGGTDSWGSAQSTGFTSDFSSLGNGWS